MKTVLKVIVLGIVLGLSVSAPVPAAADTLAYVTNARSNNVAVINTATNTVDVRVAVGSFPFDIEITPDGAFAYVTNSFSDNVSVIDLATNAVDAIVPGISHPLGIEITPDGAFAYVASWDTQTVTVIDTATNTVASSITLGSGVQFVAVDIAITPDGAFVYVTNTSSNSVSVIDTASNTVAATVPVFAPNVISITPNGAFAYVTNSGGRVDVISTATNTTITWFLVESGPEGIAFTPDGSFAYVANQASGTVSVIDTATHDVVDTIPVGMAPFRMAVTPNGAFVYVTNRNSDDVSVINTATNVVDTTLSVGADTPNGIAISPQSDGDGDGVPDDEDNAPNDPNPDQSDVDEDGVADVIDPCPSDPTDGCDPDGSASESVGEDGGMVATNDGDVAITIPMGALADDTSISITDMGEDFVLSSDVGQAVALFGVEIQPEGTVFNVPITLVFAWDDNDDDGKVDGTNIQEKKLIITKDNVAITGQCQFEAGCDQAQNTFTFSVMSLSEFTLAGPLDSDNDGIPDEFAGEVDVCPIEDATGFDVDDNGCIDSFGGLLELVSSLVIEGVIAEQMEHGLLSKIANAENSFDKDKICTAINQLEAFKNQVAAQIGKKISAEAASMVTDYADSVNSFLESQLPDGEVC